MSMPVVIECIMELCRVGPTWWTTRKYVFIGVLEFEAVIRV